MNYPQEYEAMDRACMVMHHLESAFEAHGSLHAHSELMKQYAHAHAALFALYQEAGRIYFELKEKEKE